MLACLEKMCYVSCCCEIVVIALIGGLATRGRIGLFVTCTKVLQENKYNYIYIYTVQVIYMYIYTTAPHTHHKHTHTT